MKKLFIIANWKSNKTVSEAKDWLQQVLSSKYHVSSIDNKEIIICPSFPLISDLKSLIINNKSPLKLGAQDISPFGEGSYTGAVNGRQIKEFADYAIVGHSERKKYFAEDEAMLGKKVTLARQYGIEPIYCVPDQHAKLPEGLKIVTYEPPTSISPGIADTPENAELCASLLKKTYGVEYVLYGGSVTSENVNSFTSMPDINGVLVGRASLDASEFINIVKNA